MVYMDKTMMLINFKNYNESTGKNAIRIARIAEKVAEELGVNISIAPSLIDLAKVKENVSIPVYAQHADAISYGSYTGHILLENIKEYGIDGIMVNHSERNILLKDIEFIVNKAKGLNMNTIVCASTSKISGALAIFNPDYIAIEPPELIGGDISVSVARPEIITESLNLVRRISPETRVLCGAGIKNGLDVKKALELGANGILVASGVVKAKDIEKAIYELANALR
ncbi:MAG: triose-phosphate isomerase [Thermoplasmata archaeon]